MHFAKLAKQLAIRCRLGDTSRGHEIFAEDLTWHIWLPKYSCLFTTLWMLCWGNATVHYQVHHRPHTLYMTRRTDGSKPWSRVESRPISVRYFFIEKIIAEKSEAFEVLNICYTNMSWQKWSCNCWKMLNFGEQADAVKNFSLSLKSNVFYCYFY
jgi:hypothetical protein